MVPAEHELRKREQEKSPRIVVCAVCIEDKDRSKEEPTYKEELQMRRAEFAHFKANHAEPDKLQYVENNNYEQLKQRLEAISSKFAIERK